MNRARGVTNPLGHLSPIKEQMPPEIENRNGIRATTTTFLPYPPDLETLVKGVHVGASGDKKIRFLRKIPVDPMTGQAEWGFRAVQDDPDSNSWGGKNVFDVYSKSQATALDGTKYSDW